MKGYKAFDKDLKCRDEQFKVGKTYSLKGSLELCKNGYHFCINAFDVYNYYPKQGDTRICEVEALGEVKTENDKSCTSKIKIIRELSVEEKLELWIKRTNSGHHNSGSRNSGDYNSGHHNSGDYNSGDYNSGSRNSGDYNSGSRNSGYYNSGDYNSGDYNSGSRNSGFFNKLTPTIRLFDKQTDILFDSETVQKIRNLPTKPILSWINSNSMSEEEKNNNPAHKTTGGFLRNSGRISWNALSKEDFEFIKSLPGFDAETFKEISGVDLSISKTIKIVVEGKEFEIDIEKAKELGLIK